MIQKTGNCVQCTKSKPVNAKGICGECTFENNHKGLSRNEVYSERKESKPIKTYQFKQTPLKTKKTLVKNPRLEKRREQIEKDEATYEEVFKSKPNECEECGSKLNENFRDEEGMVIARWQYSHILGKGAHNEYRNMSWNFQKLCLRCHQIYEFGDRKAMKTYRKSKEIVLFNTGLDLL